MNWRAGDHVVFRNRRLGRISHVFPVRVVYDGPDFSALHLAAGTPVKQRVMPDGSPFTHGLPYAEKHEAPHRVGDGMWRENLGLMLTKPGEAHSFWAFWRDADWEFLGWYVNCRHLKEAACHSRFRPRKENGMASPATDDISSVYPVTTRYTGEPLGGLTQVASLSLSRVRPDRKPTPHALSGVADCSDMCLPASYFHALILPLAKLTLPMAKVSCAPVNLQAPLERTPLGFDSADHVLDITVEPGGSWAWKDEGEFEDARRMGRFTENEANGILAEAGRAESKIRNREWPLGSEWEEWRPSPEWTLPTIPEGWDKT